MVEERKSVRDWIYLSFIATTSIDFIVAILDFVFIQNLKFQVFSLVGLFPL